MGKERNAAEEPMGKGSSSTGISRRSFLGGATVAAASAAVMGLAGCSPQQRSEAAEASSGTSASAANRWQSEAGAAWRTAPEPVDEGEIEDAGTYDLVIVGGGQSGTWTARSAARNGLSVAVIESQPEDNHIYCGGEVGTVNCQWAIDNGAQQVDKTEFMQEVFRRNAGRSNQRLIGDYADHSGRLLDEVIEEMGPDWMAQNAHVGSCPPDESMVIDPSGYRYFTGTVIFRNPDMPTTSWAWADIMAQQCRESQVDGAVWAFEHHAEYLEKDDAGRVTSVVVKSLADGAYKRYTGTKGVVLTGGDFAGNVDMLRDINDEYRHLAESMGDIELAVCTPMMLDRDGSAISMGVWAGGHIEVGPHAGMNTGMGGANCPWGPGSLTLNQNGRRFCDECAGGTEGAAYLIPRQPRGAVVVVQDANWQDLVYAMPPCHGAVDYRHAKDWQATIDLMASYQPSDEPQSGGGSEAGVASSKTYCADTVEQLVKIVGVWDEEQQAAALEEIKRYQGFAEAGLDEDFGKDPRILAANKCSTGPFYAIVSDNATLAPGITQTTGLDVDDQHHVLDSTLNPIPGLFAAGNNAGNRFIVQYATPLSGMSLGFCLTEGCLLGERIAAGEIV